jgi:molybdate transport system substrate-binding protein
MLRTPRLVLALAFAVLAVGFVTIPQAGAVPDQPALEQARPTAQPTRSTARPAELTVFAAASLTDAYKQIGRNFEAANPGVKVVFNFAGSQQLAQQIAQGAPADVFASANQAQFDAAVKSGRIAAGAGRVFIKNRLVVITAREATTIRRLQDLARPGVKVVFAAKAVPVGQYSLEFLDKASANPAFGATFRSKVEANVVSYEENVRSVLAKVALGEADAGIVYGSDVIANPKSPVRRIDIPNSLNVIASYPIAPLNDSENAELAQQFVNYMSAGDTRLVLAKHGFMLP